ncbi:DUF2931 family protein [Pedobacter caeni]|uniref:DUF2931 family protein n=1 Tax=Pedobacter caeni TaxID=288992 RepID=A0A1M4TSS4_9SPHI|nr:DUF2931 family protein [Pedobacter caeni]SHE47367.1 Protein of unknown function [Pedobacter caeni]
MKLNLTNKVYIGITILLIVATAYKNISFKGWERYNYSATILAPSTFPIHIIEAHFLIPGDDFEIIDREWVNDFSTEWDTDYVSGNHAKIQRLPEKIVLRYASYRDEKFYSDTLELPKAEIKSIFKHASGNKQFLELSSHAGKKKGLNFVIGIANSGNLVVWLRGVNLEKTLLKTRLRSKEPKPDDTFYEKQLSKKDYLRMTFGGLANSIKSKIDSGINAGANYIDTPSRYIEKNKELWEYQKKNGFID